MKAKVGVLIHGFAVLDKPRIEGWWWNKWLEVVWGIQSNGQMGRIPMGILTALEQNADIVVFGTGSSKDENGKIEAEIIRDHAIEYFGYLGCFHRFFLSENEMDVDKGKQWLTKISVAETKSQNTQQEIENAVEIFLDKGVGKIFFVSSPDHLSRVVRHATASPKLKRAQTQLFFIPSEVPYTHTGPAGVVVIEPPDNKVKPRSTI